MGKEMEQETTGKGDYRYRRHKKQSAQIQRRKTSTRRKGKEKKKNKKARKSIEIISGMQLDEDIELVPNPKQRGSKAAGRYTKYEAARTIREAREKGCNKCRHKK